jgi:hypothetical protein
MTEIPAVAADGRRDEEILAIAADVHRGVVSYSWWDLFFTRSRVVFSRTAAGLLAPRNPGWRTRWGLQWPAPSDVVAAADPQYVFAYPELTRVLVKLRAWPASIVLVEPRSGRRYLFWGRRIELRPIAAVAAAIRASGAPLEIEGG